MEFTDFRMYFNKESVLSYASVFLGLQGQMSCVSENVPQHNTTCVSECINENVLMKVNVLMKNHDEKDIL